MTEQKIEFRPEGDNKPGDNFSDGELVRLKRYGRFVGLDAQAVDDDVVRVNFTNARAHEIADWIKANVPEPKPLTLQHWEQVKVGDEFGFTATDSATQGYFYTKISDTEYRTFGGMIYAIANDDDAYTLNRGLVWRTPEPNNFQQVEALPVGTIFQFDGGAPWLRTADGILDLLLAALHPGSPITKSSAIPANWTKNHFALNIIREGR